MTFSLTLTGASAPTEVYAGLAATRDYVRGILGAGADAFLALADGPAGRVLVNVTRYIDRQSWAGTAEFSGTTLQFPRSGLANSPADAAQLAIVAEAVGELCALASANAGVLTAVDTGANIRRADAGGGVGVEFFNPTTLAAGTATRLPWQVQQLLGAWLDDTSGEPQAASGQSGGCESSFRRNRWDQEPGT